MFRTQKGMDRDMYNVYTKGKRIRGEECIMYIPRARGSGVRNENVLFCIILLRSLFQTEGNLVSTNFHIFYFF